jgi:transposase-like protein
MNDHMTHLYSQLGGLTRRQALTATPETLMYEILDERAKRSKQFELSAPTSVKVKHLQTLIKLGVNAAAHQTGVSTSTLRCWADIVLTQGQHSNEEALVTSVKYPYLHLLKDNTRTDTISYTAEFKRQVVADPGTCTATSKKFNVYKSLVQSWRFLATNGRYHKEAGATQPLQYGLKELSPLSKQVADLEAENEKLKSRLAFFEKFKRELSSL